MKNNVIIQALKDDDLPAITNIQPEGWPPVIHSISFYCSSPFCFPLKATIDGKLVGTGTAIIFGQTAWLAHIIVHKDYRNSGIGSAITQSLVTLIRQTPCGTILLIATALGEPIYRKSGFEVQEQYVFMDDGALPATLNSSHILPYDPSFRKQVLELDVKVSGERREVLLAAHWENALMWIDDGTLYGYFLPTLGEGLIVATHPVAAEELMRSRYGTNKMFCLPESNESGVAFLANHGYKVYRKASRMILGKKIAWNGNNIYSRIGGNLG